MTQIGIARFWHEANSFSPTIAYKADFEAREWIKGPDAASFYVDTQTEIGGVLRWQQDRSDVSLVFSRCASAMPSGPIDQVFLATIIEEIATDPAFETIDALYLSLHGASIGTKELAPETVLLRRLRWRFPDLPIVASFDMHACLSDDITDLLDGATVYREYPHTDMDQAGIDAIEMAHRLVKNGTRGHVALHRIDHILPSFNMRTDAPGPMTEVRDAAKDLSGRTLSEFGGVYPFAAFAFADTPFADSGAVATSQDEGRAKSAAQQISDLLNRCTPRFRPNLASADDAVQASCEHRAGRTAILEPSDNPLSGGIGDTPGLLHAALEATLPEGSVFAFICDRDVVSWAHDQGIGAAYLGPLGGKLSDDFGPPVQIFAEVVRLTEGQFANVDAMERGMVVQLGKTAVLKTGPLKIIVTENCVSPNDREYFNLHGIDLNQTPLLLCKAKNHFMAAFGAVFDTFVQCDTPGPAMANVAQLPYRRIPAQRLAWLRD